MCLGSCIYNIYIVCRWNSGNNCSHGWDRLRDIEVVWTFMKFKIYLYFWGVFGPWRGSVASYTTDERAKNGQKERWRLNVEELKLQIKSSSEKFRRLHWRQSVKQKWNASVCSLFAWPMFLKLLLSGKNFWDASESLVIMLDVPYFPFLGAYLLCLIATIWPAVR